MKKNRLLVKKISFIAIFSSISVLLYYFPKFSLPIFPKFLEINFSMLPIIIATFMIGPVSGSFVVLVRFLLNLLLEGTYTAGVGEITDLILGLVVVNASGIFYRFYRGKHKDLLSFTIVIFSWILTGALLNAFFCLPLYLKLYFNNDLDAFLNLLKVIPNITKDNYIYKYILYAVIPFNLIISVVVSIISIIIHKKLKPLYDQI